MKSIDTNVIVRLIAEDEPVQAASAEHFIKDGAWVSVLALAEAVWVLDTLYHLSPKQLMGAIERLLGSKEFVLQDADSVQAALEQFRSRPSLGFSDCLILEIARKAGHLPLGTFDRSLAKIDGVERL